MNEVNPVFKFNDAIEYLNYEFESRRRKNNRFSLRAWSRQLGYANPSFVSNILRRERTLNVDVAAKFSGCLKLTGDAKKYFELLVLLSNSKSVDEKNLYIDILEGLLPKEAASPQSINIEVFRVISDWYHSAILELVELKDFKNDTGWIRARLGNEVTEQVIEKAIERLVKIELLEKSASGKLVRVKDNPLLIESYIPSEAIRHFHKQMLEKTRIAIDEQKVSERYLHGSMISIQAKDYAKIQNILKKAHVEILKYSSRGNGDELYYVNTQFFRITARKEGV